MFQNNLAFEIADQYSDRPMEFLKSLYDISCYVRELMRSMEIYHGKWKFFKALL